MTFRNSLGLNRDLRFVRIMLILQRDRTEQPSLPWQKTSRRFAENFSQ